MAKLDTWMPLVVDKYLGDTTHLTTEQHGAYLLLLMAMWKRDGSLPDDATQLALITRLPPARWRANRDVLMGFFTSDGSCITQKRLTEELERAKCNSAARSTAGAKGAANRWQADSKRMANAIAKPSQTDAPIPIPIEKQKPSSEPSVRTATAVDVIFANGIPLLTAAGVTEKNARSMLGLMRKQHGDDAVVEALNRCAAERPMEPVAWLQAALKPHVGGRQSALEARNAAAARAFVEGADVGL